MANHRPAQLIFAFEIAADIGQAVLDVRYRPKANNRPTALLLRSDRIFAKSGICNIFSQGPVQRPKKGQRYG
jgi:hypothetical protein